MNHDLRLTEEEAMGLLDIVMLSPMDLTSEQRAAALKLSEYCRKMLRESAATAPRSAPTIPVMTPIYAAC